MNTRNTLSLAILTSLGLAMSATSFSAQAIQAGDMFARFTATTVNPNDDSTAFTGVPVKPLVDSDTQLGVTFVYMIDNNLGFEVLVATPFTHEITVEGLGRVGETSQLPPTFSVQYYFNPESKLRPYVGAGLNYTVFFHDKLDAFGNDLELDDSFGLAAQVGVDYDIDDKWFLSADVRYISIETTATNSALGSSDVDINPTVFSFGVGYKF